MLAPLPPLTYEELPVVECPDDTAGLLYETLLPVFVEGFDDVPVLPGAIAAFCLVMALLTAELPPDDLDAVTLLRDDVLPPIVPRLVVLLVPTPLLTVVLPLSVNTRSSLCVSWRGPCHILLEKCPPLPRPGPPCP